MKQLFSFFAMCALIVSLASSVSAQNRSVGAQRFVMDDGAGNFLTLQPPASMGGNYTFTFPLPPTGNPPAGFVGIGTAGQTLFWNAAAGHNAWEASSVIQNNTNGNGTNVTITAPLIGSNGASISTSSSATALSVTSTTPTTATALSMNGGRFVAQSTVANIASGGSIPSNVTTIVVGDNATVNSPATATLPAGTEGQVLLITTNDPDGVTINSTVNAVPVSVTIDDSESGTFTYLGGQWRLSR